MPGNAASPFELSNESGYQRWRAEKLRLRAELSALRVFEVSEAQLENDILLDMQQQLRGFGFFIWQTPTVLDEAALLAFNRQFGLDRIDANIGAGDNAVTRLQAVSADDHRARYIPYSNKGLNWHTDGYYNPPDQRIRSFCLYCANPAAEGGENFLFDHELLYILLRDQEPELVEALMATDALSIPANEDQGTMLRGIEEGPVFSSGLDADRLHMRYSTRPKNIVWKDDSRLQRALRMIKEILADDEASIVVKLQRREGVLTNNILHGRNTFSDGELPRLMYRARYYDEICFAGSSRPLS